MVHAKYFMSMDFLIPTYLTVLTISEHVGHLDHVSKAIFITLPRRIHKNFGFDWQGGFREE